MPYVNAFIGKAKQPTRRELGTALGESKSLWDELVSVLKKEFGLKEEWNSYSLKAGWALRMKKGDRNIVYLSPLTGQFLVSFILGDKAVKAALAGRLPARVVKVIKAGKRYPEGTAVRIEVEDEADISSVRSLAEIKLQH